jgi:hypothetical protein
MGGADLVVDKLIHSLIAQILPRSEKRERTELFRLRDSRVGSPFSKLKG